MLLKLRNSTFKNSASLDQVSYLSMGEVSTKNRMSHTGSTMSLMDYSPATVTIGNTHEKSPAEKLVESYKQNLAEMTPFDTSYQSNSKAVFDPDCTLNSITKADLLDQAEAMSLVDKTENLETDQIMDDLSIVGDTILEEIKG